MNHHPTLIFLIINLILIVIPPSFSQNDTLSSVKCPLNFYLIRGLWNTSTTPDFNERTYCQFVKNGLHIVEADYLRRTDSFVRPLNTSESCWNEAQIVAQDYFPDFDVRKNCGFETDWISVSGCMNITNRKEFESKVDVSMFDNVESACNQRLDANGCASCSDALLDLLDKHLNGASVGNITGCYEFPFLYALAFTKDYSATVNCLFITDVNLRKPKTNHKSNLTMTSIVVIVVVTLFLIAIAIGLLWCYRSKKLQKLKRNPGPELNGVSALNSFTESTTLVKYTIDDIKEATRNFALENMIGRGGFGNVYKGVLVDDSEVAVKRFKNCSAAADASFRHEVEVIGSVQHVNLVALRGYCSAVTPYEGYQRIIVCDLIKNGSLHDHLFEYALYGQLTERSDVYSFGVVLLELLSGRKALIGVGDEQPALLADWAWSLWKVQVVKREVLVVKHGWFSLLMRFR
ncbi:Concanavalin A-like lectin/glucanase, subgroup [Artemisia annua]|uniref:Concanavalin A-like lectin/glucanase, subgroup n=1 Tax=Artemisia annua TaxID=35608 RepID=A0A2U1P080_ARTAN|nr:Concanavalin A-like lectin/glucanase, subgroup [Artemisia annua]